MCVIACTRKGADALFLAQVKALHEAILRSRQEHVHLSGVEAHLVDCAFVLCKQVLLLVAARPSQVPRHHCAIGGRRGQQVLLHLVPHHIGTAEVQ